ncbi:MAG: zinc ribbon domain-containing protein [Rubrivivax sp.]
MNTALPPGLPMPVAEDDGLSAPYWEGLSRGRLLVQRCRHCGGWQWGPEWICHACLSFDLQWQEVEPRGRVYASTRVWHPVHPALAGATPYDVLLVELPQAGNIRMLGNRVGAADRPLAPGLAVRGVFEPQRGAAGAYALLNWRLDDDEIDG